MKFSIHLNRRVFVMMFDPFLVRVGGLVALLFSSAEHGYCDRLMSVNVA